MKILESAISEDLKMALSARGIRDTEDLLNPLYADDLADIKKKESAEVAKELEGFMVSVRFDNSTQFGEWE